MILWIVLGLQSLVKLKNIEDAKDYFKLGNSKYKMGDY